MNSISREVFVVRFDSLETHPALANWIRWIIALKGIEPHNKDFAGYGIHGTIDTTSIGKQASMGCIRMMPQDVEVVYELLTEPNSIATISP